MGPIGPLKSPVPDGRAKSPRKRNIGTSGLMKWHCHLATLEFEGKCGKCNNNIKDSRVDVQKPRYPPTHLFLGVACITNNYDLGSGGFEGPLLLETLNFE